MTKFFFRRELQIVLQTMVDYCVPDLYSKRQVSSKWIFLMPLIHFLEGTSQPYQNLHLSRDHRSPDGSWWGVKGITDYIESYKKHMLSRTALWVFVFFPPADQDQCFDRWRNVEHFDKRKKCLAMNLRAYRKRIQKYDPCLLICFIVITDHKGRLCFRRRPSVHMGGGVVGYIWSHVLSRW